jgi:transcriptional regulator with XRE-family HTH domain
MPGKPSALYPRSAAELRALGARLRDARLRRRFSMATVCVRADISRPTLYKIESGDPAVTMGSYVQVLRVLGLERDVALIAKDDVLGRSLQDEALPTRRRAPRRARGSVSGPAPSAEGTPGAGAAKKGHGAKAR